MEYSNVKQSDMLALSKMKEGNRKSYEVLFHKYYPILYAYSCQFVSRDEAQEVAQEVMLWVWENRENLFVESSFRGYIIKIAHHRLLNYLHRDQVKQRIETLFYERFYSNEGFYDEVEVSELAEKIAVSIQALPETYREAFLMSRMKGMTYKEIADLLQVSPKTVDYRIQQALKLLRTNLRDFLPLYILACYLLRIPE